jgi:hypothetical protein
VLFPAKERLSFPSFFLSSKDSIDTSAETVLVLLGGEPDNGSASYACRRSRMHFAFARR